MRLALAAVSAAAISAIAMPAAAQNSEGARILGEFLNALTGQPAAPGQQPGTGPAAGGAAFAVTDLRQDQVCEMTFTGTGSGGSVAAGAACPGALGAATRWSQPSQDELALTDSAGRIQWRGERVSGSTGWIGGAADTLRVYSIAPSGNVGPQGAVAAFTPEQVYGAWRVTETGETYGCRLTFAQNPANTAQNMISAGRGCPASVGSVQRWTHRGGVLTLVDAAGRVRAELTQTSRDRWTGMSGDVEIVMTRI